MGDMTSLPTLMSFLQRTLLVKQLLLHPIRLAGRQDLDYRLRGCRLEADPLPSLPCFKCLQIGGKSHVLALMQCHHCPIDPCCCLSSLTFLLSHSRGPK